jgi:hypothetical protein
LPARLDVMETSKLLGFMSTLLIMLINVQGTTPKNSSIAVQHRIAVALSFMAAQRILKFDA